MSAAFFSDTNDEVSALIASLHATEQRLEELTSGEIDSVVDGDGRMFLLRRAQERLRHTEADKQAAILNALPAHIALLDMEGCIISVNETWRNFGRASVVHGPGYEIGRNYLQMCGSARGKGSSAARQVAKAIRALLKGRGESFSLQYSYDTPTGKRWFLLTVTPLANNQPGGALITHLEITQEKRTRDELGQLAKQMTHAAEHDFLTGLPNRMLVQDRISQAIAWAKRHGSKVVVMFLDLDGFKHVNDSLGHRIGDKLLRSVALRLRACIRDTDTVSRQGGDEFITLLVDVEQSEDAANAAKRILQAVGEVHTIGQHDLHITASVGISIYPDDGPDADTLIQNADTAMYQAKKRGRDGYQFFTPAMNARAVERQAIEEGLRHALGREEFALHYQPKIDLRTGTITGAEALLRWAHPTRGLVSPAEFIPVAEDCGLIRPIGAWVLRMACEQAQAWAEAGLPTKIAVNVSASEFGNENFLENLSAILSETGLDPASLELELTESVLMEHATAAAAILQTLRERGVRVAIDDFGTGYSSLSYLQKFPVDILKIDQSFIRRISNAKGDTAIVTAVIGMARNLKLRVVAEGVETPEELAFLRTHRCDEVQGYLFSRPVPAPQFAKLLANGIPAVFDHLPLRTIIPALVDY